jgi:uncharacterized membrane protein (UPF0127 family)
MKDMLIPIDIVWIDESKKIVDISSNIEVNTFPNTFSPKEPARYVLEVPKGFIQKNEIKRGDRLEFKMINIIQ